MQGKRRVAAASTSPPAGPPFFRPRFLFRKLRECLPHALLRPLTRAILSDLPPGRLPLRGALRPLPAGLRQELGDGLNGGL